MCDRNGGRRLRQWLIEQIDSSLYPGLVWENDNKSMFRIPWKHAGKQDYNQEVDASIFKAWALFKGKFKEGDKAEPATWKTRLRCALNKSPDFEEVGDRSQLDISEPYKVYRIVPEEEQKSKIVQMCGSSSSGSLGEVTDMDCSQSECEEMVKEPAMDEYLTLIKRSPSPLQENCLIQPLNEWWPPQLNPGLPSLDMNSLYNSVHQGFSLMAISFYYVGKLVGYTTTSQPNGCRISLNYPLMSNDKPYTPEGMENIRFPPEDTIQNERQKQVTRKLFGHLERGVLLHCNRQGIFIKRLCQGRVFWSSNCSLNKDRPTKLDRDEVVKIFDTNQFIRELQTYYSCQGRYPESRVTLCFGEEFPDSTPLRFKLIIVQIEQVALRQLTQEAEKGCGSVGIHAPQEAHHEQMTHIVQDICGTHQRSFFRENQQITV